MFRKVIRFSETVWHDDCDECGAELDWKEYALCYKCARRHDDE